MLIQVTEDITIPGKKIEKINSDPEATAKAINLLYVNDSQEGITRITTSKGFRYICQNKPVKRKSDLERIRKLAIPPAWEKVWICAKENGHLQATGLDARGRKQYKYHPLWNQLRNHTKFYRMLQFGRSLPDARKQVAKDLELPGMPCQKILAAVVALMERTSIRIGSGFYEKMNGSFGLTTFKNKHVNITGSRVMFSFKGKKGIEHEISIKSRKLASIVKQCREIPGKQLFQYYDTEGNKQIVDSGMVNDYIRSIMNEEFTAKDFRTWAGTAQALLAFRDIGPASNNTEAKKKILEAIDKVSQHLGNTRTICKKYYVHPAIMEMYENDQLGKYLVLLNGDTRDPESITGLAKEEKVLLKILEEQ